MTGNPNFEVNDSGTHRKLDQSSILTLQLQRQVEGLEKEKRLMMELLGFSDEDLRGALEVNDRLCTLEDLEIEHAAA